MVGLWVVVGPAPGDSARSCLKQSAGVPNCFAEKIVGTLPFFSTFTWCGSQPKLAMNLKTVIGEVTTAQKRSFDGAAVFALFGLELCIIPLF